MNDPQSKTIYDLTFKQNQKLTGVGSRTTCHLPCPFCAAPDWMVYSVVDALAAFERGAVCEHCHRGARALVARVAGGVSYKFVQTCGAAPPSYLPAMPRDPAAS
jgi:hypothetical protein